MKAKSIEPHLDIFTRDPYISPAEFLIVGGVAVGFEAFLDESLFTFVQPTDCARIIGNEGIRDQGNDNGEKTFLQWS